MQQAFVLVAPAAAGAEQKLAAAAGQSITKCNILAFRKDQLFERKCHPQVGEVDNG